ncbi:unnamed protein product [Rotaria sp. Silwood2]|nr:unnamed protein product [Rotaria sp. Silwood2]
MLFFLSFRCILIYIILVQSNIDNIVSIWPSSNSSDIHLLGLFYYTPNVSDNNHLSIHARAMFKSAVLLSNQYNITIDGKLIGWKDRLTNGDVIDVLSDTCLSVSQSNIVGIVGPTLSRETVLISSFGKKLGLPVISYAATDPDLSDVTIYPNLHRTVPSDNTAASVLLKLFNRFNWKSCLIIYQNDAFGSGAAKTINDVFNISGIRVAQMVIYDIATNSIRGDMRTYLVNSPSRIVILWAESIYTSLILKDALDSNLVGPFFTWIINSKISFNSFDKKYHQNLIGMLLIEPVIGSVVNAPYNIELLHAAYNIWQKYENETYPGSTNVDYYALFAFDATWALIKSLEKLCSSKINNSSSCLSFHSFSFCFDSRFNQYDSLLSILARTNFLGVSGSIEFSENVTDQISGSYYSLKNVQPSVDGLNFVSVLEYFDPGNWRVPITENVIIWPGNSLTQPADRAILRGVSLRVGITLAVPFTMAHNVTDGNGQTTTQYIGYIPDLIQLLTDKIGFNATLILAPSNQTYTQNIQLVNNGVFDIIVGDVTVTAARRETVSFSHTIFDNSLSLTVMKTPDVSINLLGFLKPFSSKLWVLALGTCIYAGILICFIERTDNEDLQNRSLISQLTMSIWYSFGNIVGYGVEFNASTAGGRFLTAGLYVLGLILVASYTANLASDLTIAKTQFVVSGLDDIKKGKVPMNRIGIRVGTASEDYFKTEISHGNQNYYPLRSRQQLYDSLLAGIIDVAFSDTGAAEYAINNIYCNLTIVGESFAASEFAIVTPKQWIYAQDLDVGILSIRESGQLDDLRQKWFQAKNCPYDTTQSTAITVEAVGGLFATFAVITFIAVLLYLWTKRRNIKNYLSKFIHKKESLTNAKYSKKRSSNENSEHVQKDQVVLRDISYF